MATLAQLTAIPTTRIDGIGTVYARTLARAGIDSIADLLHHVPYRYVDRSHESAIGQAPIGEEVTLVGEILKVNERLIPPGGKRRKAMPIVEAVIGDPTGQIKAVWFNQPWRAKQLAPGSRVVVSGAVESFKGLRQMQMPDLVVFGQQQGSLEVGRVVPVHSVVGTIKRGDLRGWIRSAVTRSKPMPDPVPVEFLSRHGLMEREPAFELIHFPEELSQANDARRRLAYDELFRMSLALALAKQRRIAEANGISHKVTGSLSERFISGLPYRLTSAQERVLSEIRNDLAASDPMHRLLQGEVGSGKTVVAVAALLDGVEGGWQGAIMAPTEVLAEQHFLGVSRLLADAGMAPEPFGDGGRMGMTSLFDSDAPSVRLGLLTGSVAISNYDGRMRRDDLVADIASGQVDIVVGTHALIQQGVDFKQLGVAVVDEQHRFGVEQRDEIRTKAGDIQPDLLIMTATPIPRTLTMTLYGDLDVSAIDEMPPGRSPVKTRLVGRVEENLAWERIRVAVDAGRQAFVVCPLVDESEKVEAASAIAEFQRLSAVFPSLRVGLIHGQMKTAEKEEVMSAFRRNDIQVLVSTTVIEVGIDVPNATVMVIEDATRFGLSQLHQLRGRVGRGQHPGECILIADPTNEESERRLAAMVASNDGFFLAEEDLRIRGYGTVFGARQSGMKDLRIADILGDFDLLQAAQRDAFSLVSSDPGLASHPELTEEIRAMLGERVEWLFRS